MRNTWVKLGGLVAGLGFVTAAVAQETTTTPDLFGSLGSLSGIVGLFVGFFLLRFLFNFFFGN